MLPSCRPLLLLAPLLWLATASWSQTSPDAGSLRQQIEQKRELQLPPAAPAPRLMPPPEIQPPSGMTVRVQTFRFAGNSLLDARQLSAVVANFEGRELGFDGLRRATDAVAAAYREAGWIVRVYLPEQDVSAGLITLQVIEARFAGVRLEGKPSERVVPSELQAWFTTHQANGQPLNANALDRALLLADDLPGVSVAGTLTPGAADGETALVLQTTDEPFIYGDIALDNNGASSTGSNRLTANLNINSPAGRGELLSLNALHTRGSDYARLAFTVPYGHNGLRLSLSASTMNYKVIGGDEGIRALNVAGKSSSLGLDFNFPLLRERLYNLYLSGGLEKKGFHSEDDTKVLTDLTTYYDYETNSLRMGLSGNQFDNLGGGGANSGSVQMQWGRLISVQAHKEIDSIQHSHHKLSYSLSRQQTITANHSLLLSLQGQHATQVMDLSEKFYIGGASTVRAYPVSELGGDGGQVLSAEWRWRLSPAMVLSAFADHGRVVSLPAAATEQRSSLPLRGHGLSVSWQGPMGISARATWSRRDGANPKPTKTGTDGDGTLTLNRFWYTASVAF
jgi:hemolysin activation/secretion protein